MSYQFRRSFIWPNRVAQVLMLNLASPFWVSALEGQPFNRSTTDFGGQVYSQESGAPVREATVVVEALSQAHYGLNGASTDQAGHFKVRGIAAEEFRITILKPGYINSTVLVKVRRDPPMTFVNGVPTDGKAVRLPLVAQSIVAGRVRGVEGEPIMNAQVVLSGVSFKNGYPTTVVVTRTATNDLGEYRVAGLTPGRYYVSAYYQDSTTALGLRMSKSERANDSGERLTEEFIPIYYPNEELIENASSIATFSGRVTDGIDLTLRTGRSASVSGSVRGASLPMRSIKVFIQPPLSDAAAGFRMLVVDPAQPDFRFPSVPAGEYVVRAEAVADDGRSFFGRLPITVGATPLRGLVVSLREPFTFAGQIEPRQALKDRDGKLRLAFIGTDRPWMGQAEINSEGQFRISLPAPDRYYLSLRGIEKGMVVPSVKSINLNGVRKFTDYCELSAAADGARIEVAENTSSISIRNSSGSGRDDGVKGVIALFYKETGQLFALEVENDTTQFPNVAPGSYRLRYFRDLRRVGDLGWDSLASTRLMGREVVVSEGESLSLSLDVLPR
ncbi:MAG: carboxypeptidase regulatory-like domain-containing protein [Bryobacterales bacterium]|nr:carboxypeptidase regulatory-like domain-containing protein [Bryobacterales bacterium]